MQLPVADKRAQTARFSLIKCIHAIMLIVDANTPVQAVRYDVQ
jgi:hypothetical protein